MTTVAEHIANMGEGTQGIAGKLSFLLGVSYEHIKREPNKAACYEKMEKNKHARIIRNLSILRTDIMKNWQQITNRLKTSGAFLLSMQDLISPQAVAALNSDHVNWYKGGRTKLEDHVIEINRLMSDRINNVKDQFPLWLDWNYVRGLFVMPGGFSRGGVVSEGRKYREKIRFYPYQIYLNWRAEDVGNILFDDRKIVSVLYSQQDEQFEDLNLVCDVGTYVKENVCRFIDNSKKLVVAVDCENADPYKLCAAIRGLEARHAEKITKIILFDDVNTQDTWRVLEEYISIPIEYILVERINKHKSLVDVTLTATVSKEHYMNSVDSFMLVSSDSDYWGMITTLTGAHFLIMLERDNAGASIKTALRGSTAYYCYLDDFYAGNCNDIKYSVLLRSIQKVMAASIKLNMNTVLDNAMYDARIKMGESEKKQFFDKYIKKRIRLEIDEKGNVQIVL